MMQHHLNDQQKVALAFSIAVNALAIGVLLAMGMSEPLEAPKHIKAVLLTPEAVAALQNAAKTDISHSNVAEQVQSREIKPMPTALPPPTKQQVEPEPVTTPEKPVEAQPESKPEPVKTESKKAEKAEKITPSNPTEPVDPTLAARLRAEKAVKEAKLRAVQNLKKEQADKQTAKTKEDKAQKEAAIKTDTKPVDTKKADQKANDLKKAAEDARKKAEANAKADAQRKSDAEAKRLNDLEDEAFNVGQKAEQDAAARKGEIKKLAGNAKKDFESKIYRTWDIPMGSSGQKATARVTLSDSGAVQSVVVNATNPDLKASIEAAIRDAAPYPMPSDPDARKQARTFSSTFTAK